MKKLFVLCSVLVAMAGCGPAIIEHDVITVDYVYVNKCSSEITIYSAVRGNEGMLVKDSLFVIPVNQSHTIRAYSTHPLLWGTTGGFNYNTTVSDGERTITHTLDFKTYVLGSLYSSNNYILIAEPEKYHKVRLYVFDDSFFKDVEPVD